MVDGGGLENRRAKAPWVRILPPPPNPISFQNASGESQNASRPLSPVGSIHLPQCVFPFRSKDPSSKLLKR